MRNLSMTFHPEPMRQIEDRAAQLGISKTELICLATHSFLAKETAVDEYILAVEVLERQMTEMSLRQELFSRAICDAVFLNDDEKTQETRSKLADRLTQISAG